MVQREGPTFLPVCMDRKHASYRDLIALVRVCAALRRFRPDIVNAGTPKAGLLVMLAAWICRVPCRIYTLRGLYLETSSGWRRTILRMTERLTCALAHRVLCVSPSLRARALQLGIVTNDRASVLGAGSSNGVDLARFALTTQMRALGRQVRKEAGIEDDAIVIGFVGRLARDKGLRELAEAWSHLRQEFRAAHLLVVGSFEDEGLSAMVKTDPRVHLMGDVEEPAAHYAAMDVVVLPTYREGLPNVVLEAGAMERPVVATTVTGCIDAVHHGVTGTLVPPRDSTALAAAITTYLRDGELRRQHGSAGRARMERDFARERVWDALHAEYTRLLCATRPATPVPGATSILLHADDHGQRVGRSRGA
jgi:glycosyltransferase involved in cell wall biosynthesis